MSKKWPDTIPLLQEIIYNPSNFRVPFGVVQHLSVFAFKTKENDNSVAHKNSVRMESLLAVSAQWKNLNVITGTIELILSHQRSSIIVLLIQKVFRINFLFYNGFRNLTNMKEEKIQKHRKDPNHCLVRNKKIFGLLCLIPKQIVRKTGANLKQFTYLSSYYTAIQFL